MVLFLTRLTKPDYPYHFYLSVSTSNHHHHHLGFLLRCPIVILLKSINFTTTATMTTVVPTSEEDPVLYVVRFTAEMSWAEAGPEVAEQQVSSLCLEAQECMVAGRWLDLASLMVTSADLVFSKASDKDLESIFTIICNLVKKPESLDELLEMAKLLSTKIAQQPNDKPALRLKILFNLYNLLENPYSRFIVYKNALKLAKRRLENPYSRFIVYKNALKLAKEGKVIEHIFPSFRKIDSLLKEWDLGVQDQRELFLAISNIFKEHKSSPKETLKFLTKYLAAFSGEDSHVLEEAKEEAARAIIEFVKAPDVFQHDLLEMPAVAQLEKDNKYASVYQLLKIFQTQRLDAYLDFYTTNSALLQSYGLVHEECIAKMRLMSIVDLASNESGRIPYSSIKRHASEADEVETWVVKAITAKLIDCKMDQMNQVIRVSRYTERVFGHHQWQALREKLATWRGNIANVITTIQANKVTEEGTQHCKVWRYARFWFVLATIIILFVVIRDCDTEERGRTHTFIVIALIEC
ncbi:putative proteasome component (PCI) domain, eukaryotic translation initiation factor 3 subunit M [Helianthus annuus]|nr:putative proteasome component (PCI) domain, eukaryotic translation initiation factor 3 subunit M [Helianthus annuus]